MAHGNPTSIGGQTDRPALIDRGKRVAFLLVASLFFSWALANSLNDVLVRHFQKALDLTRGQSGLIQSAFYAGYFVAAIPAGILMRRAGYKAGIITGLTLYAMGALLFLPAADARIFGVFLCALFTIACGLACLETAANPYIAVMGDPRTGAARLNIAQAFFGLGSILGPMVGGLFILSGVEHSAAEMQAMGPAAVEAYRLSEAQAVKGPYLVVALIVIALAVIFYFARLPAPPGEEDGESNGVLQVLKNRRLLFAVASQFCYIGAQVTLWSYFIDFSLEMVPQFPEKTAAFLLSGSLAALMIGRLLGGFILNLDRIAPARLLAFSTLVTILLVLTGMVAGGYVSIGAIWLTSLFTSIIFPTIFAMGVRDLGPLTKAGSSLLIMSVVGGAIIPAATGWLADWAGSLRLGFALTILCLTVILAFALTDRRQSTG